MYDLVITDPPFSDNLFYADLADFFYVWMRIGINHLYKEDIINAYFEKESTPKIVQVVRDPAQHKDDRNDYEKVFEINEKFLALIREKTGNFELEKKDKNPLFKPEPASDFYERSLTAVWQECSKKLKVSGLLAFTFHHNQDEARMLRSALSSSNTI